MGFLVIGMLGTGAWSSTVWGSGNAIQSEVYEGTITLGDRRAGPASRP